jgi:hypothetical protein
VESEVCFCFLALGKMPSSYTDKNLPGFCNLKKTHFIFKNPFTLVVRLYCHSIGFDILSCSQRVFVLLQMILYCGLVIPTFSF